MTTGRRREKNEEICSDAGASIYVYGVMRQLKLPEGSSLLAFLVSSTPKFDLASLRVHLRTASMVGKDRASLAGNRRPSLSVGCVKHNQMYITCRGQWIYPSFECILSALKYCEVE